ncbi:hypothetical protein PCCS19_05780 [Paenibacillus sp. CCS19]|uniref:copper amine oxidase N-terminal domain-containing protein n=1 Tax=Paenibacillus sp. CCS19 TaxID=3158387 RepID=UPI002566B246|nr:copper amine oxidase N-terminal domain-containing protein [Paenibacillus cellulosilyticus]GMK37524.1 hypothetical protein PCCS19_05780 [Paenibacillus cellulosilyticus]
MKKVIAAFAVIGMICCSSIAAADERISIVVKNKQLQSDSDPIVVQGRVLLPLRAVSESLGASVEWNQRQKTAIVSKWSKIASLTVGKKTAWVDNFAAPELSADTLLDVSVTLINNRVYVPLRFISEQLGYMVDYKNNTVSIRSPYAGLPNENSRAQILSGDLERSRSYLVGNMSAYGLRNYEHRPLKTNQPAASAAYLFPEGEALRFFMIENNSTITFFEYKDDFFVATWQAYVEDAEGSAIQQLFADRLKGRTGHTPLINKRFAYFYYQDYMGPIHRSGYIDTDGTYTETAYDNILYDAANSYGTLSFVLPNEVRKETVTVTQTSLKIP